MVFRTIVAATVVALICAGSGWAELSIQTDRHNIVQGEPMRWQVETDEEAETLVVTLERDNWRQTLHKGELAKGFVDSDVGWLHEGKYVLTAELVSDDKAVATAKASIGIYPPFPKPRDKFHVFSWGAHWGDTVTERRTAEEVAADLAAHHIDLATLAGGRGTGRTFAADQAYFADVGLPHRVRSALNINTMHKPLAAGETHEQVASQAEDGTLNKYYDHPTRCFNRPDTAEIAIPKMTREYLLPGVRKLLRAGRYAQVIIDDELGLGYVEDYKICCYCPYCRETFRKKYGYDMPSGKDYASLEPTIVPDDHPWLNFYDFRTRQIPKYLKTLARHVKSISHPDTVVVTQQAQGVGPYSGANLDNWTDWQDVINLHSYPLASSPSTTAFAVDVWRQGDVLRRPGPPRPMWLMIQASWGAPMPDTGIWPLPYAAEQIHMAMASGVQSIGLFTYNGLPGNQSAVFDYEWFDALGHLLGQIKQLSGLWMEATPSKKKVALLNSVTTDAFMSTRGLQDGLWYQWHIGEQTHAALLRAHLPTEVIGEQAIRQGRLDDYEALVLMHCQYLPESVAQKIAEFIKAGGKVYCDQGTKVPLHGLIRLPFHFTHHREQVKKAWSGEGYRDSRAWEPQVREQAEHLAGQLAGIRTWYTVDDLDTIGRGLEVPGARLLYLVNSSAQNYSKDPAERVDPIVVKPTATVPAGSVVYDLLAHKQIATEQTDKGVSWTSEIPGGGGAIFLVADTAMDPVTIDAPRTVALDTQLDVKITVGCANCKALWAGTAPLEVELTDAAGQRVEFGGPVAAVRGIWRGSLPIARNAPVGEWTLHVMNLADGKVSDARFAVVAP